MYFRQVLILARGTRDNNTIAGTNLNYYFEASQEIWDTNLHVARLDNTTLKVICDLAGIELDVPKRKSRPTRAGYDNSHQLPFSEFGNGETFPEPAPLNRARGAKPVDSGGDK
jgi:hypothetical protein